MTKRETVYHALLKKRFTRFRIFNGERFELAWADRTKKEAESSARTHKAGGQLVRIVKTVNGYAIYIRPRRFYTKKRLSKM
jgi:hypothetical protein